MMQIAMSKAVAVRERAESLRRVAAAEAEAQVQYSATLHDCSNTQHFSGSSHMTLTHICSMKRFNPFRQVLH
jgi:hypothetical protein